MIRDVVDTLGYGTFAAIALTLFFTAFLGVCMSLMFASRATIDRQARIPLNDHGSPNSDGQ